MTAKEAADLIREKILPCVTGDWKEAADMAISALSNATQHSQHVETVGSDKPTDNQSVKQTDFADCLINKINSWIATGDYSIGEVNIMRCVIAELEDLPTVEPERKKGKWIIKKSPDEYHCDIYICDQCKEEAEWTHSYCPHCGADMTERSGDEDD